MTRIKGFDEKWLIEYENRTTDKSPVVAQKNRVTEKPKTEPHVIPAKRSKYNNKKVIYDGKTFDSVHEYKVYLALKQDQAEGRIQNLECQVKFQIELNGIKIAKYIADFCYQHNGKQVIADAKSPITRKNSTYRLKAKLIAAQYGIKITEL